MPTYHVGAPFKREHANQLVDSRLRRAGMRLQRRRVDRLPCGDRDERRTRPVEQIMAAAKHVEGAVEIDIHHGTKRIRRHAKRGRQEITCRARNDNVHRTQLVRNLIHHAADRRIVPYIARLKTQATVSAKAK